MFIIFPGFWQNGKRRAGGGTERAEGGTGESEGRDENIECVYQYTNCPLSLSLSFSLYGMCVNTWTQKWSGTKV
jgi:hypothetical protein